MSTLKLAARGDREIVLTRVSNPPWREKTHG
jgi:hypothetical protein